MKRKFIFYQSVVLVLLLLLAMPTKQLMAQYCMPTYSNGCSYNDLINNVYTTGAAVNISNLNSGCNGSSPNYTTFFSNNQLVVQKNQTFTLFMQSNSAWPQGYRVWIDWNGNGSYSDAGEMVYYSPSASTSYFSANITVPNYVIYGETRMRITCQYNAVPSNDPCQTNRNYGETEDYPVIIPDPIKLSINGLTERCSSDDIELSANVYSYFSNYKWYRNGVQIPNVNSNFYTPTQSGNYYVSVYNSVFQTTDTSNHINLTIYPTPAVPSIFVYGDGTFCDGDSIKLEANGSVNVNYQWSKWNSLVGNWEEVSGATNPIYWANGSQYIMVKTSLSPQCPTYSNDWVYVNEISPITSIHLASNNGLELCNGSTIVLEEDTWQSFTFFEWYKNNVLVATTQDRYYEVTSPGVYKLKAGNKCDTLISNEITITIASMPEPVIDATSITACVDDFIELYETVGSSTFENYQWFRNNIAISDANGNIYQPTESGNYNLVTSNACTSDTSNTITITINPLPTTPIIAVSDDSICFNEEAILNVTQVADETYQWQVYNGSWDDILGETNDTLLVDNQGYYRVIAYTTLGSCMAISDYVEISVTDEIPVAEVIQDIDYSNSDVEICEGDGSFYIYENNIWPPLYQNGATYTWYKDGVELSDYNNYYWTEIEDLPSSTGNYWLKISTDCQTINTDTIHVTVNPLPTIPSIIVTNASFCPSGHATIYAQTAENVTFQWQKWNGLDYEDMIGETNDTLISSISGDYRVIVSNSCGDEYSEAAIVTLNNTLPDVAITITQGQATFCDYGYAILQADFIGADVTYSWYKNNVLIQNADMSWLQVDQPGYYQVKIQNQCGFDKSDSIHILVNASPVMPVLTVANDTICYNQTTNISTQQIAGVTYQWFYSQNSSVWEYIQGQNTNVLNATQEGYYRVKTTKTSTSCFQFSEPVYVEVIEQISNPYIDYNDIEACAGSDIELWEDNGGYENYKWFQNGVQIPNTNNDNWYYATQTGNYFVQVSSQCQTLNSDTVHLDFWTIPIPPIVTAQTTIICQGDEAMVVANNPNQYDIDWYRYIGYWDQFESGVDTIYADMSATYTATFSNHGCTNNSNANNVTIGIYSIPDTWINASSNNICEGETATLNVEEDAEFTYQWFKNGVLIPNETMSYLSVTQAGSYNAVITGMCNPDTTDVAIIDVITGVPQTFIQMTGSAQSCSGQMMTFTIPVDANQYIIKWYLNGQVIPFENDSTLNGNTEGFSSGDYYVYASIENTNGCTYLTDPAEFTILQSPAPHSINAYSNYICANSSIQLYGENQNNASYQWYKDGQIIQGATASNYFASQAGVYTLKITNPYGCYTMSDEFTLETSTQSEIGNIVITANNANFCNGSNFTITAPSIAGANYYWYLNGSYQGQFGNESNSIQSTFTGTYYLYVENQCSASQSNVIVTSMSYGLPEMPIIESDGANTICAGGNRVIYLDNYNSNYTYKWFKDGVEIVTVDPSGHVATTAGSYTVVATNGCGSVTSAPFVLTQATGGAPNVPTFSLSSNSIFCSLTGAVTLTITNVQTGVEYVWIENGGGYVGTGNSVQVSNGGYYFVVAQNACGESVSSYKFVNAVSNSPINPNVMVDGNTTLCASQTAELYIDNTMDFEACTFQWYKNGVAISGSTQSTIIVSQTGDYSVAVINPCGTTFSSSINVNVSSQTAPSTPVITAINGQNYICSGMMNTVISVPSNPSLTYTWFEGTWNGFDYDWSYITSGVNLNQMYINSAGTYAVNAENASGCSAFSAPFEVEDRAINSFPIVNTIANGFCQGETVNLFVENSDDYPSATYVWYKNGQVISGATTDNLDITQTGNYSVMVQNTCGSISSPTFGIQFNAKPAEPTFNVQAVTTLCPGQTQDLVIMQPNNTLTYEWFVSMNGFNYFYNNTGIELLDATSIGFGNHFWYYVLTTNENGCYVYSDTLEIVIANQIQTPIITAVGSTVSGSVMLAVINPMTGANYQWYKGTDIINGATGTSYEATQTGYYHVKLTTPCGNAESYEYYVGISSIDAVDANVNSIYPNPASDKVFIDLVNPSKDAQVKVYNSIGQVVSNEKIADGTNKITIDVNNYEPGVYYFELSTKEGTFNHKIVVMNK